MPAGGVISLAGVIFLSAQNGWFSPVESEGGILPTTIYEETTHD